MYLHYYLNEKYVGVVDIETFFASKNNGTLIACDAEADMLLDSLEMMYGKKIERFTVGESYELHHLLRAHLFTTKKVGPVLRWSDQERALCV